MTKRIRLKPHVKIALFVLIAVITWGIVELRYQTRTCNKILVNIHNPQGNFFLNETDVLRLLTQDNKEPILGKSHKELSLKTLEQRLKGNLFVEKCQIARNLQGDLLVEIVQVRPIARFIREDKPDFYVDSLGKIIPVSEKFTARVPVVTSEKMYALPDFQKNPNDAELLRFLQTIFYDKFLKAQIAQIHLDENQEITLYLQVGQEKVFLGNIYKFEEKLQKLKTYYQKILPNKGWNAYKAIDLQFDRQILCKEK
ncbi:MAG: cell division protein FtsQ [Microscillaceae bacterium]|nr:cell division protein FtsQ [Microscillaceae bacterium]MDW8459772.1 cell division protein FtsQ/DivIB [Cytophagales bacterium]